MSKIERFSCIYTDVLDKIHETEEGIICCGRPMKMIMHIDGDDFYEYTYQCECGNQINIHAKRDDEDMW